MNRKTRILAKFLLLGLCIAPMGCETFRTWQANPNVQFAETEALKLAAAYFSNGGNADTAWSISNGLSILGDVAAYSTQSTATTAQNAKAQVRAFADDKTAVNGLATGVANIIITTAPKTASQKAAIVQAVSDGIGKGAAAVTAP